MKRPFYHLLLCAPLAGCVSTGERNVEITPAKMLTTQVGNQLVVEFPSGDVSIEPSTDGQLHAAVSFFCNADSESCRSNAAKAKIVHEQQGEQSRLAFKPGSAYSARHANLVFRLKVPKVEALDIEMDAGALTINSPTGCLKVASAAGDVTVRAPFDEVAAVALDANFGDASLRTPAGAADGRRPLLVGAEVLWEEGKGNCDLRAKLQAGSISVELE